MRRLIRTYRMDLAWAVFVVLNLLAMQLSPAWQTVPFLTIWLSLTAIYGLRLWRMGSALATVLAVTAATGGLIGWQVLRGKQDGDYLAEVPLLAMMFVVMVWHSRRRQAALEEMKRVSDQNLLLLDQQRQFLQDASHELGTPIAIALGHAELIERAATDQEIAADARVAVDELMRMRRLTSRMLLLAAADGPAFLRLAPVHAEELVVQTLQRWGHVPREWSVGMLDDAVLHADADRLTLAIDALVENAVEHTDPGDVIEVSTRREDDQLVLTVADSGPGIPAAEVDRIFTRFARVDAGRNRAAGGFGLGLAIVKAIAAAHHGSVHVHSTVGQGSAFELRLPAGPEVPQANLGGRFSRRAAAPSAKSGPMNVSIS
ncbi:MAG TPA: HAMP domain-containing sensor histidine kinase [Streptosporangiaceae bacterium]|nr:HAMP domain-containing sensor histidine kinase [Streptosporangiaceae bacterium]